MRIIFRQNESKSISVKIDKTFTELPSCTPQLEYFDEMMSTFSKYES